MTTKRRAKTRASVPGRGRASRSKSGRRKEPRRWSHRVMRTSDALDLEKGVFTKRSARQVALSLKRSADRSSRRKSAPFRSAMSMLNFHINRAGRSLPAERKRVLRQAKQELRQLYGRS